MKLKTSELPTKELQNLWATKPAFEGEGIQVFRSRREAREEARLWRAHGHKAKVYHIPVYHIIPDQGP